MNNRSSLRLGLSIYPQETSWNDLAAVVRRADQLGYDSVWSWDHLLGIGADARQPVYEAWATVAAWATITQRATVGLLVSANTFRNPGLVAKSAVTVDHISGGRFVLGLGAAYRELEHRTFGFDFGSGFGQRLAWLDESVSAVRRLLAGETVTSRPDGHYRLVEASTRPLPVRGAGTIPILIPGAGETKTLPILARHGDYWHVRGGVETLAHKLELLRGHCEEAGRSLEAIELITGNPVVIRDDPAEAEAVYDSVVQRNGQKRSGSVIERAAGDFLGGPPEAIAEAWRPFVELGFRHLVVDFASPYDRETLERLPEVRELLDPS
jgi:alkanesulfonate monooxygenase SsuD/methylene tetrahydromethanopterin reductase-like flavin-dependent oxidoreductase (luciferase family)